MAPLRTAITGVTGIDAEWDTCCNTVEQMGAQDVLLLRGRLEIARFLNGVYWDSESVPLSA